MIVELRTYIALPGRLPALLKRFREHTVALFERHGIRQGGFYTTLVGPDANELTYTLLWNDLAEREAKWAAFQADPDWHKVRAESEKDGPINALVSNKLMVPTDFSAVK